MEIARRLESRYEFRRVFLPASGPALLICRSGGSVARKGRSDRRKHQGAEPVWLLHGRPIDTCSADEGAGENFYARRIFRGECNRGVREPGARVGTGVSRREAGVSERAAEVAAHGD